MINHLFTTSLRARRSSRFGFSITGIAPVTLNAWQRS
jgi:hypothetical protein